jgi:hypothetical protein
MGFPLPKRFGSVLCIAFCCTIASTTVADPGEDEDNPIVSPCSECDGQGASNGDPDDYDLTRPPTGVSASVVVSLIEDLVRIHLGR